MLRKERYCSGVEVNIEMLVSLPRKKFKKRFVANITKDHSSNFK